MSTQDYGVFLAPESIVACPAVPAFAFEALAERASSIEAGAGVARSGADVAEASGATA